MTVRVSTVGIDLPDDFLHEPYDAVPRVHHVRRPPTRCSTTAAWNAVVYRFLSCANLTTASPPGPGRGAPGHPQRPNRRNRCSPRDRSRS